MNLDFINSFKEDSEKIKELLSENKDEFDYDEILKMTGVDIKELEKDMLNYRPKLDLGFTKLNDNSVTPFYNYPSDSGFDLYSTKEVIIPPFGRALVPTGLSFDIKDGYEIQVRSKSGLAIKQGLMVLNSPGTVDNGYTGEVKVIIFNTNNHEVQIQKGMKVGQAVLCPVVNGSWVNLVEHKNVVSKDRGDNGFGSTGI
jgi:dUTP pyrophosphatase